MDFLGGEVLYFKKPYSWTSFKLVGRVRWLISKYLNEKKIKVGHAGTLDPLATGVMIVCTGKATKLIETFQNHDKEYVATLRLGATTPSHDLESGIDEIAPYSHISRARIDEVLAQFVGDIMQVPPTFSAVKIDGKRAYRYARQGEEIELQAKPIHIEKIEVLEFSAPILRLKIECGKGTYIRALARDIGAELGCGAHLTALERTRVGKIRLENCIDIKTFENNLKS